MNKKIKLLSIIPLYGTCILFIYLFILSIKDKISKKKFFKIFTISAVVSVICWFMIMMITYIISKKIIYFDFNTFGIIITMIVAGYMINAFSFIYINQKWNYLLSSSEQEKAFFIDKKKILLIGLALALIVIIFGIVTIFTLELI